MPAAAGLRWEVGVPPRQDLAGELRWENMAPQCQALVERLSPAMKGTPQHDAEAVPWLLATMPPLPEVATAEPLSPERMVTLQEAPEEQ